MSIAKLTQVIETVDGEDDQQEVRTRDVWVNTDHVRSFSERNQGSGTRIVWISGVGLIVTETPNEVAVALGHVRPSSRRAAAER